MSDMSAEAKQIRYLLKSIIETKPDEINCDEAQELVHQYVDLDLSGAGIPDELRDLHQHLEWCGCCRKVLDSIKIAISQLENGD